MKYDSVRLGQYPSQDHFATASAPDLAKTLLIDVSLQPKVHVGYHMVMTRISGTETTGYSKSTDRALSVFRFMNLRFRRRWTTGIVIPLAAR